MKIHTDLAAEAVAKLARDTVPSIDVHVDTHGSRKRKHRHDVVLTDNGRSLTGRRQSAATVANGAKGITYDEWGLFIEQVFLMDESAKVGPYRDRGHFRIITDYRFDDLKWEEQHARHRFEFNREHMGFECDCGAIKHRNSSGFTA